MNKESNVSSQVYGGLAMIMKVLVFASIAVGILLLLRIIFLFFGSLKTIPGYEQIVAITDSFIGPLKSIAPVETPYEGRFDIAATVVLILALVLEFVVHGVQNFLERQSIRSGAARPAVSSAAVPRLPEIKDDLAKK